MKSSQLPGGVSVWKQGDELVPWMHQVHQVNQAVLILVNFKQLAQVWSLGKGLFSVDGRTRSNSYYTYFSDYARHMQLQTLPHYWEKNVVIIKIVMQQPIIFGKIRREGGSFFLERASFTMFWDGYAAVSQLICNVSRQRLSSKLSCSSLSYSNSRPTPNTYRWRLAVADMYLWLLQ